MEYDKFLKTKQIKYKPYGFMVDQVNEKLFDFQQDIVKWALMKGKAAIFAGTGLGKCMGFDTPILMYDGTIKNIQDILPGDLLMGPDSKQRTVKSTTSGQGELYKVTPIKGKPFVCNDVHVLSLKCTSTQYKKYTKNEITNMPLNEYIQQGDGFKHMMKLWRTPIDFKYHDLDIDPYFIGVWIGDGNYQQPKIHKTDKDIELCNYLEWFAEEYDTGLKVTPVPEHNSIDWYFTKGLNGGNETWILKKIRECHIDNEKRIPTKYLINSTENRMLMLAGLLDTDGHLIDNVYEITTKYKGLSDDILFLARSLGFAAYCNKEKKTIKSLNFEGWYYRIHISGNTHTIPLKLRRKKATPRRQKKDVLKTGFNVESIGNGDYYGFELSGDGLYVLGDFTVTHNTAIQLEWSRHVAEHTKGNVLILAPLAVAQQTVREGIKFGIGVNLCRTQSDVKPGINITNYEMLHNFDVKSFVGIVLDESSILKSFGSKTRTQIIDSFRNTPYKLALTATPAPNDVIELTNHCEFIGVMSGAEMLSTFFVHDTDGIGQWRLKGHSKEIFWQWMSRWSIMFSNPADLGYDGSKFDLPPLNIHEIVVDKTGYKIKTALSLNERRAVRKESLGSRVACAAEIANNTDESVILWCNLNEESKQLTRAIDDVVEVKGADSPEHKTTSILGFAEGNIKRIISKGSIMGFGLNMQICHIMVFVGIDDSFEKYYQSVRRCWRFGQTEPVDVYIITSEKEGPVLENIKRKERQFDEMLKGMIAANQEINKHALESASLTTDEYNTDVTKTENSTLYLGDNIEVIRNEIEDNSIDYSVFSPPFSSLFTYSDSVRDMGNCRSDDEFYNHFRFLSTELLRIIKPGRLVTIHCMLLPTSLSHDGMIGLKDFRGDLIRIMQETGFIFHSEVTIYKDPVQEMYRTKSIRLLHKQVKKDTQLSGQARADYGITFRKPGTNAEPIAHTNETFSVPKWQRYADPVWMDINQMDVLSKTSAREKNDEKHICPLQLDAIGRFIDLWSNPGDTVFDPFAGIGSVPYRAVLQDRKGLGIELKESYYSQACDNVKKAEYDKNKPKQVGFEVFE